MLARITRRVCNTVNVNTASVHLWTDSTVVLDWLDGLPCNWKTFVANRVSEIQTLWPRRHWNHVATMDNPADCASKGLSARELLNFDLWWRGPAWLAKSENNWPTPYLGNTPHELPEQRVTTHIAHSTSELDLISSFGSLSKLKRITAYCLRFAHNCKKGNVRCVAQLTPEELQQGLMTWVKIVQRREF